MTNFIGFVTRTINTLPFVIFMKKFHTYMYVFYTKIMFSIVVIFIFIICDVYICRGKKENTTREPKIVFPYDEMQLNCVLVN